MSLAILVIFLPNRFILSGASRGLFGKAFLNLEAPIDVVVTVAYHLTFVTVRKPAWY
jgi:hypothetical protein